jgi:hypothetical protein
MHDCEGEVRLLRQRLSDLEEEIERLESAASEGEACLVGVTVSQGSYPTVAGRFYALTVQAVTGTETEGSAHTLTAVSDTIMAANLGTAVPTAGTAVPVDRVPHRWVFRYDG